MCFHFLRCIKPCQSDLSLPWCVSPSGVAFKKTFSYAGFEQQPKSFVNPKILLLNIELELKAEKENAEVRGTRNHDVQASVFKLSGNMQGGFATLACLVTIVPGC